MSSLFHQSPFAHIHLLAGSCPSCSASPHAPLARTRLLPAQVLAKFRDFITDLIKKKEERIKAMMATMAKIKTTATDEVKDSVVNAVDVVLKDHGKLITASCAAMKKQYEASYVRKVGIMTKFSQCESSSLTAPKEAEAAAAAPVAAAVAAGSGAGSGAGTGAGSGGAAAAGAAGAAAGAAASEADKKAAKAAGSLFGGGASLAGHAAGAAGQQIKKKV